MNVCVCVSCHEATASVCGACQLRVQICEENGSGDENLVAVISVRRRKGCWSFHHLNSHGYQLNERFCRSACMYTLSDTGILHSALN